MLMQRGSARLVQLFLYHQPLDPKNGVVGGPETEDRKVTPHTLRALNFVLEARAKPFSVLPEAVKSPGIHLCIASRVGNLAMPQVGREGPRKPQQEGEQRAPHQAASGAVLATAEPAARHLADDSSNRMFTLDLRAG